jgi:hypothetical protein
MLTYPTKRTYNFYLPYNFSIVESKNEKGVVEGTFISKGRDVRSSNSLLITLPAASAKYFKKRPIASK